MNHKKRIISITVIIVTMITVWLVWSNKPFKSTLITTQQNPKTSSHTKQINSVIKPKKISKKNNTVSFLASHESAALISKVYAAELSYPPYSQPLQANNFDRLNPNYFNPQKMIINDQGDSISATLSKYRYIYPEPIIITLEGDSINSAAFTLTENGTNKTLANGNFTLTDDNWQLTIKGSKKFPEQPQAKITANVNGNAIPIVLALQYINPIATITSFETATAAGSDMEIKANITTEKSGLYRVSANLFDANNQPIAHLVMKEKLSKGYEQISLKAHQSVLVGKEAPFTLSTFMVELMSPSPGVRKRFGHSLIAEFTIADFNVSSLDKSAYQASAAEMQRLELLQQMANDN